MAKEGLWKTVAKIEKKFDKPRVSMVLILFAFAIYLIGLLVYLQPLQWQIGTEIVALFGIIALTVALFLNKKIGPLVYGGGLVIIAASHILALSAKPLVWAGGILDASFILAIAIILALFLLASAAHFFLKGKWVGFLPKLIFSAVGFLLTLVTLIVRASDLFKGHENWAYDELEHASTVFIIFGVGAMLFVWLTTALYNPFRKEEENELG